MFLDVAARRERVARSPRVDTRVEYRACNAVTNRRYGPAEDAHKNTHADVECGRRSGGLLRNHVLT